MGRLDGKIALVTGGGSGLGKSAAIHMAEEGANVIVSDINLETATETVETINKERQGAAIPVKHNVTNEEDWNNVLALCESHFSELNILLNNAGISIGGDIESTEFETWKKLQEVDVDSIFWGCKLAIPILRKF